MSVDDYQGFKLTAHRDDTMGGDACVVLSATRVKDGWDLYYDVNTELGLRAGMQELKDTVDDYVKHPEQYDD